MPEVRDLEGRMTTGADVALLTVHGDGDDNVYVTQGERITAELQASGAQAEFVRIEGRECNCHEDCWRVARARQAIHRFLNRMLSHEGNRFFEEKYGTKSPLRD